MSRIVVDTDVASYLFNQHSLAEAFVRLLRGSQLVLSFMSIAELRMGAIAANWVTGGAPYWNISFKGSSFPSRMTSCAPFGRGHVPMREQPVIQSVLKTHVSAPPPWRSTYPLRPTTGRTTRASKTFSS
jgi:hypothetical protein